MGKKPGPKPIEIDWKQMDGLCKIQATRDEVALYFGCSIDTIDRACERAHGVDFATYYERKKGAGKISLRRKMFQMAMKGDRNSVPILIYLDKKHLGGLPSVDPENPGTIVNVQQNNLTVQQAAALPGSSDLKDVPTVELVKMLMQRGEVAALPAGSDAPEAEIVEDAEPEPIPDFVGTQGGNS